MFFITSLFTTFCLFWMATRIWKTSPALATVSFFVLPVAIIPLIQNWGDEETDIRLPFFLALGSAAYTMYSILSFARDMQEEKEALLSVVRMLA